VQALRTPIFTLTTLLLITAPAANAQLALRQSEVVAGAYSTIGNLLIDCPTTATCDNNTAVMAPVDVDQDATTSISSSATLVLPAGAAVTSAVLYVTGSGTETTAGTMPGAWIPADPVAYTTLFKGPSAAAYTAVAPLDVLGNADGNQYLARFDVTALVTGDGEYFVADPLELPASHPFNRILSWVLFVTYEDGSPPLLVNLYDGALNCFMGTTTLNFAGFRTPAAVAPEALFTAWSVDGHPTLSGESITVGTVNVSNPENPSNNIGNATVTSPSGPITRNPATFRVTEEMDLDTFDVSSAFTTSQTSTDIAFTCGNLEGVVYHLAVIGVQIVAPVIDVEKSVVDLNGGEAIAGDELVYELRVQTGGGDDAVDVVLRDVLPDGLAYVAQSIEYVAPVPGMKSDQAGDDQAEWTGTELVFRLGAGASATAGGTIAVGLEEIVRFHARVESATVARAIVNQASLTARGAQGGSGMTLIEVVSSSVAVDALPCSGFENGMCPDAGVVDAGLPDSGELEDAGVIEEDATTPAPDATTPAPDATTPAPDATTPAPDATTPAPDASASNDAGADDTEDGDGCGCTATRRRDSSVTGLALLALAFAPRLRRRRDDSTRARR
jgi:uncharacterized repeat protein (TIGR01451 family)/MYXO-CTERM domain-containing protein